MCLLVEVITHIASGSFESQSDGCTMFVFNSKCITSKMWCMSIVYENFQTHGSVTLIAETIERIRGYAKIKMKIRMISKLSIYLLTSIDMQSNQKAMVAANDILMREKWKYNEAIVFINAFP